MPGSIVMSISCIGSHRAAARFLKGHTGFRMRTWRTHGYIALYLALDQRKIVLQGGRSGRGPQSIPIADFTVLLSTTDEYALLQPLRDRMKLNLRFTFYSVEELVELTRQRSRALGWDVEPEVFPLIAQRSRGTPRLALRLL